MSKLKFVLQCVVALLFAGLINLAPVGDVEAQYRAVVKANVVLGDQQFISTVVGGGNYSGDGGSAAGSILVSPHDVFVDGAGNVFIVHRNAKRIRKIDAQTGVITTVAGGGSPADGRGDGGAATEADFVGLPNDVFVDASGHIYIAELYHIRKVDAQTGVITTIAGVQDPEAGVGEGGPATEAYLGAIQGLFVTPTGDIYLAARTDANPRIRKIDAQTGIITTIAGNGQGRGFTGDGGLATEAQMNQPTDVFVDSAGNVFIVDKQNKVVRKVDAATGVINTVAGIGGSGGFSGDGGPATEAQLQQPYGVFVDGDGNIFIADRDNNRIRKVDAQTGVINTVIGSGTRGFAGDGGQALEAALNRPWDLWMDDAGNTFIADRNNSMIRKVDTQGIITTIAGGGNGDGDLATGAVLNGVVGVAVDGLGNLYVADPTSDVVRKVDGQTGMINTIGEGFQFVNGPALAADASGNLYIADMDQHVVRKIDAETGAMTTITGNGEPGFSGDGGLAINAVVNGPRDVAVDGVGNVYVADTQNRRVRKIDAATGIISTIGGNGNFPVSGDGGQATDANISFPQGLYVTPGGDIYIADPADNRIRKIDGATGIITKLAGAGPGFNDGGGFSGDGGLAVDAFLSGVSDVYADAAGDVYFSDRSNNRIRKIDAATGIISTVVGATQRRFSGDGGPVADAFVNRPSGIAGDAAGNLYFADGNNLRIRKIGPQPASGLRVEFARSASGSTPDYLWSNITDAEGSAEINVERQRTPFTLRLNVSGYYTARAVNPTTGSVIAQWHSIPIQGGQETTLTLPVGAKPIVLSMRPLAVTPLLTNYPNPFNPATTITYEVLAPSEVSLVVYNTLGQQIRTLVQSRQNMGAYHVSWDGKDALGKPVSTGVYFYTLKSNGNVHTQRMMLLK